MSETKTTSKEEVKQEGDFKLKSKKKTPKKLGKQEQKITKVNINPKEPLIEIPDNVTKVEMKKEEDAIQIGETKEVPVGEPSGDSPKVGKSVQESNETSEGFSPISEVTEEEIKQVKKEVKEAVRDEKVLGKPLPENIEKLVNFMEKTGGTIEDYTRLNADYSNINEEALLKEFYKKSKPHLDDEEIGFVMEENFYYDEEVDEERDVKRKKLAKKEAIAEAKNYLEDLKQKYYDEIKLRPGVTQEQQKATDFFNRYNEQQEFAEQQHNKFKQKTKELFNENFKGFDISVGEKKYKYNVQNRDAVVENQSNISNLIGKFLDGEGNITDPVGYHKAIYAAENVDQIASHFYEQGKADAVKDVIKTSKNLSDVKAREGNTGEVFVGGFKVKSISGADSTKLKIKKRKFNN
ncbi:hypothetical protein HOK09_00160 [Candidatus Woesearchaeota archaeon]|jgi:hypothetical protein|nr:hypothetical protein [Candidatus Woesearchaeota archaeon]